jgi:hypothetical protein
MKVQTIENIDYFGEDAVFTVEKKQHTIYEITRPAIAKDGSERTSTTYHLIEEHAKIAEERDILKSKLDIKQGESAKYLVKYAEHIILIPRREYIITGNQLDQFLKDIKRGKVECGGFKNTATLDFDNVENERITEIK